MAFELRYGIRFCNIRVLRCKQAGALAPIMEDR